MFYYLSGTVAHVEPYLAVIDCGGVGYACRTTTYTLSGLKKGDKGKLYTYLNVREDAMELYGFATQEELNLFQQLISVSGVGPKAALSILSASTPASSLLSAGWETYRLRAARTMFFSLAIARMYSYSRSLTPFPPALRLSCLFMIAERGEGCQSRRALFPFDSFNEYHNEKFMESNLIITNWNRSYDVYILDFTNLPVV